MSRTESFGSRIAECRQNRGMTQEDLAGRIGVTPQALSKWERNQSLPDISILSDLCFTLGVSADYLLGTEKPQITEDGNKEIQNEIWERLKNCLQPLEVIFGKDLLPVFTENEYVEKIVMQRKSLSTEGILMPLVRVRDEFRLEPNEFMILSYQRILYAEKLPNIDEKTCEYIAERLGETVRGKYAQIINPDLVKCLTDNLRIKYPALVGETVPERISYGMLTDVMKRLMERGNSMIYLEKVIEILGNELEHSPKLSAKEMADKVSDKLNMEDDFSAVISKRK